VTQPEDCEQQLVVGFEIEVVAAPEGALAVRAVEPTPALGGESKTQVREHLVEESDRDPGQVPEDGRETTQPREPEDHRRLNHLVSVNNHTEDLQLAAAIVKKV
jgi:hypothetical protein